MSVMILRVIFRFAVRNDFRLLLFTIGRFDPTALQKRDRRGLAPKLDSLLSIPDLATMLYAEPIGPLPDLARGRKNEPPVQIIRQTDAVTATHKRRPSTCREARATVRKVWKEATRVGANAEINTLGELLLAAGALDLDQRTRRKAARLQEDLLIHKEAL